MQACRKFQLGVPLPFTWGPSWDSFFHEGTFLSKGANGSVYKAVMKGDPSRRPVAVKVVLKNTIFSLRKWHHMQREVDCLRNCRHPNIIELIAVCQSPEAVFIVLEYAAGGDLFDWAVTRRVPSEAEVKPIAAQLMSTLQFMHDECNAVHRDIKPENILIERRVRQGEKIVIKLADFGFARIFPKKPKTQQIAMHPNLSVTPRLVGSINSDFLVHATPCGTLGFAPPEVLKAFNEAKSKQQAKVQSPKPKSEAGSPAKEAAVPDHSNTTEEDESLVNRTANSPTVTVESMKMTDIFAAGVTLCILLIGAEPFPCHSSKALVEAVNRGLQFGREWSHVSMEAREIVSAMLDPVEKKRPTARAVLQSKWLSSFSVSSTKQSAVAKAVDPPPAAGPDAEIAKLFATSLKTLKKHEGVVYRPDIVTGSITMMSKKEFLLGGMEDPLEAAPSLAPPGPAFSEAAFVPPAATATHSGSFAATTSARQIPSETPRSEGVPSARGNRLGSDPEKVLSGLEDGVLLEEEEHHHRR
jgi:serine/threonine protein kinase